VLGQQAPWFISSSVSGYQILRGAARRCLDEGGEVLIAFDTERSSGDPNGEFGPIPAHPLQVKPAETEFGERPRVLPHFTTVFLTLVRELVRSPRQASSLVVRYLH
jgi:hypothetical protein